MPPSYVHRAPTARMVISGSSGQIMLPMAEMIEGPIISVSQERQRGRGTTSIAVTGCTSQAVALQFLDLPGAVFSDALACS